VLPLAHPAVIAVALVAAAALVVSVSFAIFDPDLWEHLAVGRAIWALHAVPCTQLWSWPTYGAPDVTPSWGFRALVWWFWKLGGVTGLFVWRWLTTLLAFGFLWAGARRMGARGLGPLLVVVLCGLAYRQRSQVRPETLVSVLLAIQIWLLESRRAALSPARGPKARGEAPIPPVAARPPAPAWARANSLGLVLVSWAWANAHLSYLLGLAIIGFHALDEWLPRGAGTRAGGRAAAPGLPRDLVWVLAVAVAVSFVNPFGWRALWQPFSFALVERREMIFRTIAELQPLDWQVNWRNGLPLIMAGWPILLLWRWRRFGVDRVELAICVVFTWLALGTQRFLGYVTIVAVPYAGRDFDAWVRTRTWPAWSAAPWRRAAIVALTCVLVGLPEWSRPGWPLRIGFKTFHYPEHACDFMAAHGVAGRGFNQFPVGGYMLWRFWPDHSRLPFMDIHQAGTLEDRRLYAWAFTLPEAWRALDGKYRFDYVLLRRIQVPGDHLLDFLDRDSTWAPVFIDDAAAVYVRRAGPLRAVADSFAYRVLPAGGVALGRLAQRCDTDTVFRHEIRAEAEREAAGSPLNAAANNLLANLATLERRPDEVRSRLREVLRQDPQFPGAHERLGLIALAERHPQEALREFARERALGGRASGLDARFGQAYEVMGDLPRAARAYRRALARDAGSAEARAGLQRIEPRLSR
jgi:hypothetical protein